MSPSRLPWAPVTRSSSSREPQSSETRDVLVIKETSVCDNQRPRGPPMPALKSNDALKIRAWVDAHWSFLARVLRNLGVPESELDDALQQCFLVASEKLGQIELGKERAFLTGTCVHMAARVRRARGRSRESAEENMDAHPDPGGSAEATIDAGRLRRRFDAILATMDEDLRDVFVLHEVEQMTMAAIAASLELAAGTVASRLRRAREWFRDQVHRKGGSNG
jgi:RNA polymerase sigma-70 factor, ECF subfamily